jgi:hypothetical protein
VKGPVRARQPAEKQQVGTCPHTGTNIPSCNCGADSTPRRALHNHSGGTHKTASAVLQHLCLHPEAVQLQYFCVIKCTHTAITECSAVLEHCTRACQPPCRSLTPHHKPSCHLTTHTHTRTSGTLGKLQQAPQQLLVAAAAMLPCLEDARAYLHRHQHLAARGWQLDLLLQQTIRKGSCTARAVHAKPAAYISSDSVHQSAPTQVWKEAYALFIRRECTHNGLQEQAMRAKETPGSAPQQHVAVMPCTRH